MIYIIHYTYINFIYTDTVTNTYDILYFIHFVVVPAWASPVRPQPHFQAMAELPGTKQKRLWLLSQSFLGWPSNRPRMYTILVLKEAGALATPGLSVIDKLYRVPMLSAIHHLVATQDSSFKLVISSFM